MAKARIPNKDITLRPPEETERLEMAAEVEEILGHAKYRLTLLGAFAFLLLSLLVVGAQNVQQINSQGIAYLLLAKHYVAGEFGLAISSYWSPFLSWLIAIGLKLGWDDLTSARVATGLAGFLFWFGSMFLFFVAKLPTRSFLAATWLATFVAVPWSIEYISPDLLGAALIVWATAFSFYSFRLRSMKTSLAAGVCWGLVYYANAMLLPVVIATLIGFGILGYIGAAYDPKAWLKSTILQATLALVIMAPWWVVLNNAYGEFTLTSAWRINYAVAGPQGEEQYHPCFLDFNPPAEGRLTNWEDPARLEYIEWSASESKENQEHQDHLVNANLDASLMIFRGFGAFGIAIVALLCCLVSRKPLGKSTWSQSWRWVIVPVIANVLAFVPFSVSQFDTRYFAACFPLAVLAAFAFLHWLPQQAKWDGFPHAFANGLVAVLFALPLVPRLASSLEGIPNPGGYATIDLVDRLQQAQIKGPIAGDGLLVGSRTGLFVAALMNQPWYGDKYGVVGTDYMTCGADYIIVHRQHRVNSDMEFNPAFRDLDTVLFPDELQAEQYPLKVYQVNR